MKTAARSSTRRRNPLLKRERILEVLRSAPGPLGAREVLERLSSTPDLSERTLFRLLEGLTAEGRLVKLIFFDAVPRYEIATERHHPHFQCRGCASVWDVAAVTPPVAEVPGMPGGLRVEAVEVVYSGLCEACARLELSSGRLD